MYDEYVSVRRFRRAFLPSAPTLGAFLGFFEPLAPLEAFPAPSALFSAGAASAAAFLGAVSGKNEASW